MNKLQSNLRKLNLKKLWGKACQSVRDFDLRPSRTKRDQLVDLFDWYANHFERNLVEDLEYVTPQQMVRWCADYLPKNLVLERVLDLGCGTGLVGEHLKKEFSVTRLVGVDFSEKMLEKCIEKKIYEETHNKDLRLFLQHNSTDYHLILASDVFIYLGDLAATLRQAYTRLQPGGYLVFSVEQDNGWKYTWCRRTGRFQHSLNYLKNLYNQSEYSRMESRSAFLRKERGKWVPGYLVLLQK